MPTVRLFHWKATEAEPLIDLLRKGGYTVDYPNDQPGGSFRLMRENPPMAAVIDLTRLPSHGLYLGSAIRSNKGLRHIAIVFVDGDPDKLVRIKTELPDATFTTRAKLIATLKKVKPITAPLATPNYMDRFAGRTTAQKLGVKEGATVALIDPPLDYLQVIGELPRGAVAKEDEASTEIHPLTIWFVTDADTYLRGLHKMRRRAAHSKIWVVYPKLQAKTKSKSANKPTVKRDAGLNQNLIRESALAVGLVDYKICSLNDVWSGMLFTIKKQ